MRPSCLTLLTLAGGCLVSAGCLAQPFHRELTGTHLPEGLAGPCMDAAAGDADGDGDLDLALAMEFQPNVLLLNDGSGRFSEAAGALPRTAHDSEDVAFADFDADGDLDLVFVSEDDRTDEFWLNDGAGRYSEASERLGTDDVSNALAVADLDGDTLPDLLTGNIGPELALINDGRGGFRDETARRWPQDGGSRTQDLEVADLDGDGDPDVVVANEGQNQLFLNEDGVLREVTATHLPARNDESREIRAADVDADGDLDLLVANVRFGMQEAAQDYLLLNDGAARFTMAPASDYPEDGRSNFTVQAVDVDRDGDLDAILPSTVFPRGTFDFLVQAKQDGADRLFRAANLQIDDLDGDDDFDVLLQAGSETLSLTYDGGELTAPADAAWEALEVRNIDTGNGGAPELRYVDVPTGALLAAASGAASSTPMLQLLDLGGDGDFDIAAPLVQVMDRIGDYLVLLNDGRGRFSAAAPGTALPAPLDGNGFDVEVADFDADGSDDLFLCNRASVAADGANSGGRQRLLRGE